MITMLIKLRRRLAAGDDRGSLAMLMLVMLIGVVLGGVMVPMVINQDQTTHFTASRSDSLNAAETGIQVVVGQIRAAADSSGVGNDAALPCGPISGQVGGGANGYYYTQIIYYEADPIASPSTTPMVCAAGYGPYDTTQDLRTPRYACIISSGTTVSAPTAVNSTSCASAAGSYASNSNSTSKGRTLVTTYVFNTDDTNFAGGVIRIFPNSSGNQYCMDAGSSPAVNTQIVLQQCSTSIPPAASQTWSYRSDLTIQLTSTATSGSAGLCLDSAMPHAAGNPLYLSNCSALGSAPPSQQWSVDDNSHLEGANSTGTDIDGKCINVASQASGIPLTMQSCAGSTTDTSQTWVPSPSTGPGMAGATNNQLVNFKLFGNCLDVTGQNVSSTYLILYTCKQNPSPSKVTWNQKFTPSPSLASDSVAKPTNVEWITTYSGTNYCLKSGGTNGAYVTVQVCPPTAPTSNSPYLWLTYRKKQSDGVTDASYDKRYTIVDTSTGLCLGAGSSSDLLNGQYLKVVTATCDGSTGQKWNADPSTGKSALQNTHEN